MISFLATGNKRLKKAGDAIQGRLYAKRRMIKCNRNVKQETVAARRPNSVPRLRPGTSASGALAVGYQLVENQRVYIASARPKHHQDDHLELVQTYNFVG